MLLMKLFLEKRLRERMHSIALAQDIMIVRLEEKHIDK